MHTVTVMGRPVMALAVTDAMVEFIREYDIR